MAFQISLTSTSSIFNFEYTDGISLDGPYEVCLKSFVTYNNIPNVSELNNRIDFINPNVRMPDNGSTASMPSVTVVIPTKEMQDLATYVENNSLKKDSYYSFNTNTFKYNESSPSPTISLTIPKGTYEIHDLARYIENHPSIKGSGTYFHLNKNTFKMEMFSPYFIDLAVENSIAKTLGFTPDTYIYNEVHTSNLTVQIFTIQTIKVKCNLIKCNINNLKQNDNTLYEFPLRGESGEKIVERPQTLCYYPVTRMDSIYQLHLKIVDQDDNIIDFRGEQISITLGFQPCK